MNDRTSKLLSRMRRLVTSLSDETDNLHAVIFDSDNGVSAKDVCEMTLVHLQAVREGFGRVDVMLDELARIDGGCARDVGEMKAIVKSMRDDAMGFIDSVLDMYSEVLKRS